MNIKSSIKGLFSTKKKIAGVVLAGGLVAGAAGVAAAYFSASATGTGAAQTGALPAGLTIRGVSYQPATLTPGGSQTLVYSVHNPNSFGVTLSTGTATIAKGTSTSVVSYTGTSIIGCYYTWFSVSGVSFTTGTYIGATGTLNVTVKVSMFTDGTQNKCATIHGPKVTVTLKDLKR